MKQKIIGIGEALWDCLPEGSKLGGAPANFAYHVSQYGYNACAISALGNDALGDETKNIFKRNHMKYIMPVVNYPTGTVQVTLDDEGVPTYDIKNDVAWDNIPFTPDIEAAAQQCRAVCFGSLAQRSEVSRTTINRFLDATPEKCLKIFDINLRQQFYTKDVICESMHRANILKINDEELVT
ncbi:MAG: carbohydrate kinase, partial [Prevotellaceae bacterium]|nr:carbohydrate kinase [Prevotellaceae bacterium]